ncbi:MAG TPA: hypothetical protein VM935_11650 [Chitinophagaceae bacterium]|jgi:hypothetical protein|nr:hypothetical protein [Chitinophagaceae bacterium]
MSHICRIHALLLCALLTCTASFSQTEFPKEFITHIRLHSGMITYTNSTPELFVGGLQVIPQVSIVPYKLRGGVIAGAFYAYNSIHGAFGPTVSYKIKEFTGGHFGSLGNLHLNFDHLWGTDKQRLAGGGINLDLLNKLVVGLSAHRDYNLNNWWIQSGIAFRISKVKQPKETVPN